MSAELPAFHLQTDFGNPIGQYVHQPVGQVRVTRSGEARATAFAAVAVEREVGHQQHLAANVENRQVHPSVIVLEDAKVRDLICKPACVLFPIALTATGQDHQSASDLAYALTFDFDSGLADSLD